jgi:hypothetical protein
MIGGTARLYVFLLLSLTAFTVLVVSFQPTTTTFKSPAVWAFAYTTETDAEDAIWTEATCTNLILADLGVALT